jgi:hypothetical protein
LMHRPQVPGHPTTSGDRAGKIHRAGCMAVATGKAGHSCTIDRSTDRPDRT